jgi:membrane-associated phospholipid phosphatase
MSRLIRRLAVVVAAVSVLAVGVSRVALNVHYPSDVLAGWSLGYLYFLLCLLVFRPWLKRPVIAQRETESAAVC